MHFLVSFLFFLYILRQLHSAHVEPHFHLTARGRARVFPAPQTRGCFRDRALTGSAVPGTLGRRVSRTGGRCCGRKASRISNLAGP